MRSESSTRCGGRSAPAWGDYLDRSGPVAATTDLPTLLCGSCGACQLSVDIVSQRLGLIDRALASSCGRGRLRLSAPERDQIEAAAHIALGDELRPAH